jgi:hypothetical protein
VYGQRESERRRANCPCQVERAESIVSGDEIDLQQILLDLERGLEFAGRNVDDDRDGVVWPPETG